VSSIANDEVGFTAAANQGRPLRQEAPQSSALADIDALSETLLGIQTSARTRAKDFNVFGRLVRAFGLV
jgi:Flp pilus assembly CpaE family ATPase